MKVLTVSIAIGDREHEMSEPLALHEAAPRLRDLALGNGLAIGPIEIADEEIDGVRCIVARAPIVEED